MRGLACSIVLFGCRFHSPLTGGDDAGPIDSAIDTPDAFVIDAPALCTTWHPQIFDPCLIPAPAGDLHLTMARSPYKIDTTTGSNNGSTLTDNTGAVIDVPGMLWPQPSGPDTALISVANLQVDAGVELAVSGPKPLIVASWGMMAIDGTIDAGSHSSVSRLGAGANPTACSAMLATAGQDAVATGGSGGGGGGAFRGNGGHGSIGDNPPGPQGGPGATGLGSSAPAVIRGGCPGAASGAAGSGAQSPSTPTTVSGGGAGGGALYLAARMDLHVHASGKVVAGGGAGFGAPQGSACGGGGAGGGGMLAFDARGTVELAGVAAANGGGGGGSGPFASFGNTGTDGQPSATAAPGGIARTSQGQTCGVGGAPGSAGGSLNGSDTTANDACGGAGGGGGAGFILVWSPTLMKAGTISPPEIYIAQ